MGSEGNNLLQTQVKPLLVSKTFLADRIEVFLEDISDISFISRTRPVVFAGVTRRRVFTSFNVS